MYYLLSICSLLIYWCRDVCIAVYITVSLYIDDVLMSVNSIHSLYHNITCQTTILESTEVLMMYRCTNVSLSISVFNVADHKQLSRWYTRCDVWCIHKLLYYYINYTLVCKDAVCKQSSIQHARPLKTGRRILGGHFFQFFWRFLQISSRT